MRTISLFAAALTLAACNEHPAESGSTAPPAMGGGTCDASHAQGMVGKPIMTGTLDAAKRRTGARVARLLRPGQMTTMEYRADRVNVRIDSAQTITGIGCG